MFPLILGAIAFGAGTAIISNANVDVDVDGDQMVIRAIEMLDLKRKLDLAEDALNLTLNELHATLVWVRVLLLIIGVWFALSIFAWVVWVGTGDKGKPCKPDVFLLGPGVEARALSAGESGRTVHMVCGLEA